MRQASEKAYCQRRGLIIVEKYVGSGICAHVLLGQQCPPREDGVHPACLPPRVKTEDIWYKNLTVYVRVADGQPVVCLQPFIAPPDYARIDFQVKLFCDKWGLNYHISNHESWHTPGQSLLIELSPPIPKQEFKRETR
jgi:hypothetical protein